MNLLRPDDLVYKTWQSLFGHHGIGCIPTDSRTSDLAMLMTFRLDFENFGYEKDGNTLHEDWQARAFYMVHVLVTSGHRCYVAVERERGPAYNITNMPSMFENTSNHDSCWRSDGLRVFSDLQREAWNRCYDHVPEEHRAPNLHSMYCFTSIGGFLGGNPFQLVRVKRGERRKDNDYFDVLTEIKPARFSINVEN